MKSRTLAEVPPEERGTPILVWLQQREERIFEEARLRRKPGYVPPKKAVEPVRKFVFGERKGA